jgi:transposase-like protein
VFPETREQRCWFHKIANVLAALPKSAHPAAKKALAEIWSAEDRHHVVDAIGRFEALYGAKFPKVVAKITDNVARWRAVNAPQRVALVRAGATFVNGKHVERPADRVSPTAA